MSIWNWGAAQWPKADVVFYIFTVADVIIQRNKVQHGNQPQFFTFAAHKS